MKLMPMQAKKLAATLKKLRLPDPIITAYIAEVQKTGSMKLNALEMKIAEALAKQNPPKFGWTNEPTIAGSMLVQAGTGVIVLGRSSQPIIRPSKVIHNSRGPLMAAMAKPFILNNESNETFMYLDSGGEVTVGIGHLLASVPSAQRLPFTVRGPKTPASPQQIADDFNRVKGSGMTGKPSADFENITNLDLELGDIDTLFEADFKIHRDSIQVHYPLAGYPVPAQIAFVDLMFQVGITKFQVAGDYSNIKAALKRRDWPRAGKEADVNFPVVTATRNTDRKNKFLEAVKIEPFFTTAPKISAALLQFLLKL